MSFVFQPSEQSKAITLSVIDDNLLEINETITFFLSIDSNISDVSIVFDQRSATVIVLDDEGMFFLIFKLYS